MVTKIRPYPTQSRTNGVRSKRRSSRIWTAFRLGCVFLLVAGVGFFGTKFSHAASDCTVSSTLVNSCRPWFGAAVSGYPQVASDSISQFNYFETRVGRQVDIFHDYHPPGSLPLNSAEIHYAERPNTYIYVNWKPASDWLDADGGNASINANIDAAAANIKSVAPNKIFLTIWHEPENDVSPGTSSCPGLKGSAGSPAQYIAMWQNVENRFAADGVTNVVWVMNYMDYSPWDCLVPQLWPGNNLVDWVTYDSYTIDDSSTWDNTVGRFYDLLETDNSSTDNFESKPWGVAEFGDCQATDQSLVYQYYTEAKAALDTNTYPRLKMYMVYDSDGNDASVGCLTNYSSAGVLDPTEQTDFNAFADDSIFTSQSSTTPPAQTPPSGGSTPSPTSSGSGSGSSPPTVSSGSSAPAESSQSDAEPVTTSNTDSVHAGTVDLNTVSGTITNLKVDGAVTSNNGELNTTYLTNGKHILTLTVKNPNGTTTTTTKVITVNNKLSPWQNMRNTLFRGFRGEPVLMNTSFGVSIVVVLAVVGYIAYFFKLPQRLYILVRKVRLR